MKARIVSIVLLIVAFVGFTSTSLVSASVYSYVWVVTYGTDLTDSNGILSFTVTSEGENTSLIWQRIDHGFEQHMTELHTNDVVTIDYNGCNITYKSISEFGEYTLIGFTGEANSVVINEAQVPEFTSTIILLLFIIVTLPTALLFRKRHSAR